jgi:hypothetical protein
MKLCRPKDIDVWFFFFLVSSPFDLKFPYLVLVVCVQMKMDEDGYFQCVFCEGTEVEGTKAIKQHLKREHGISKVDTEKATQLTKEEAFEEAFFNTSKAARKYLLPIVNGLQLEAKSVKRTKDNNSITYTTFVHKETSNQLEDIPLIDGYSTDLENLVDPEPEPNIPSTTLELEQVIENSSYPKLLEKLGPYQEVDHNFIEDINGARMGDGVKLLCGGILSSSQFTLVILAAETYCRDGAKDSHAEKSNESYPELLQKQDRFYEKINVCISKEGDGRNTIKKLLFGFGTFKLLITGSLLLHPADQAELQFGPSVHPYFANDEIKLSKATLFLRRSNIDVFDGKAIDEITPSVFNARQLTSSFNHASTYFNYRSTLFQAATRQPATVFTLSKLPSTEYGITATHISREVSQFFELLYDLYHENINVQAINDIFPHVCKKKKKKKKKKKNV